MENRRRGGRGGAEDNSGNRSGLRGELTVVILAALIFLAGIASPPSLMDDVDAVQAQIARNMYSSGDWVTARLNGIPYLEKAPLKYWMIAVSYSVFGVHDWAARIPLALCTVALCWLTVCFGRWAFSARGGTYSGMALATCAGLFLFTRVLIPDVMLTLAITLALWSFLRALDPGERRPRLWAAVLAASLAVGVLLKGLIALIVPGGAAFVYLLASRQLLARATWRRLHPLSGLLLFALIAAPWHILAIVRNPPFFDFTMKSEPGKYHGFFWFYFLNEHLFRFLNIRYPRDYNTVPRLWFWLLQLVWLFPWSVFAPAVAGLRFSPTGRAGHTRLLALCWAGFLMVFFSFSTTQEYYSMPIYPALALLLGSAMAEEGLWIRRGFLAAGAIAAAAAAVIAAILVLVHGIPATGDISAALTHNPGLYTLSLGHMGDLTLRSFAYLRAPLALAGLAFLAGASLLFQRHARVGFATMAVMMFLFLHAARLAMVAFDPYLSSRPLAEAIRQAPPGKLIIDDGYYTFSSVFFYTDRDGLLLNGRVNNLVYGSYAPGAPEVFLADPDLERLWRSTERYYLVAEDRALPRLERGVGASRLYRLARAGGKSVFTNQPVAPPDQRDAHLD